MFGGVQDKEDESEDEESDEEDSGNFFNELYTVQVEGERATWHLVTLTGKLLPLPFTFFYSPDWEIYEF